MVCSLVPKSWRMQTLYIPTANSKRFHRSDIEKCVCILLLYIIWQAWSRWRWAGVLSGWVWRPQGSVAVGLLRRSSDAVMAVQGSSSVWFSEEGGRFSVFGSCSCCLFFQVLCFSVVLLSCWGVCSRTCDEAGCLYGVPAEHLEWVHMFWKVLRCFHGSGERAHHSVAVTWTELSELLGSVLRLWWPALWAQEPFAARKLFVPVWIMMCLYVSFRFLSDKIWKALLVFGHHIFCAFIFGVSRLYIFGWSRWEEELLLRWSCVERRCEELMKTEARPLQVTADCLDRSSVQHEILRKINHEAVAPSCYL